MCFSKLREDPEQILQRLGMRFRSLRVMRQEAVDEVARHIDIPARLLERIEKGLYDLEVALFVRLCSYYDVAPSWMMAPDTRRTIL